MESCCALLKHLLQGQLVAAHNLAADDAASAAPAAHDSVAEGRRSWGDYADVRPHPVLNAPAMPPRNGTIKAFA